MCGITGMFNPTGEPIDRGILEAMNSALIHRGPDGEGYYHHDGSDGSPSCGLAQRRLSIIDLEGGRQPLANEDGSIQTVVNGEFYNYLSIRKDLENRGHRFATDSDSEILVHLYEQYGHEAIGYLRGMFALALWDGNRQQLILARDRMGQKPLFWTRIGSTLLFASETKAFFAHPAFDRRLNTVALGRYLRWLYLPGSESMLEGVRRLLPGHVATVDRTGMTEQAYWKLPGQPEAMDETEAVEEFDRLLIESVSMRLMSDVPLGAFLSGGIDSSLVSALMANQGGRPKTFTVSFGEKSFDESAKAAKVAALLDSDHIEVPVVPNVVASLDDIIHGLDEPMADSSAIPTYWLCQATRRHVTVALSGDGGDELLAGYRRYVGRRLADHYNKLPILIRQLLGATTSMLPHSDAYSGKSLVKKMKMFQDVAGQAANQPDTSRIDFLTGPELRRIFSEKSQALSGWQNDPVAGLFSQSALTDPVARMQWVDCLTYLPDDILVKVDRMSMANSLEVRSPLMDHRLVEFLAKVPMKLKLKGLTTKYLMKQVARKYLPDQIIDQPKQGFEVPLGVWFKNELNGPIRIVASESHLEQIGILNPGAIDVLIGEHVDGRADRAQVLWGLLVLEMWLKRYRVSVG